MKLNILIFFSSLILFLSIVNSHKSHASITLPDITNSAILQPEVLRPYMFEKEISGKLNILNPTKINKNKIGQITSEQYTIDMVKTTQQILPSKMFGETTIYAYGGSTYKGYYAGFPGPAIIATKDRPIKITWRNMIPGPHILPVDYNFPFINDTTFRNQVPTVPHVHGLFIASNSDGGPQAYWTKSGKKGMSFWTYERTTPNTAIYVYPNDQDAGNFWFHDHAYGITRLNVYAGLASLYKIVDEQSYKQQKVYKRYGVGQQDTRYLAITDKSFKTNGQLYYHENATNKNFDSWEPEFFGNTMLVNGVLWPKMTLKQGIYRFVLLNACQSRFLNIWFENEGEKIPFELIRTDGTYYNQPVQVTTLLATISTRFEIIIDLRYVQGQIILKNNANAPYPIGDEQNFKEQFNGQILRIVIESDYKWFQYGNYGLKGSMYGEKNGQKNALKKYDFAEPYPRFQEGQKVFMTLFEVENEAQQIQAAFINGLSMMTQMMSGDMECMNTTYKVGKTYDFYFINLTPDAHPIHFHLVNMQKIKQFKFDFEKYAQTYFSLNGGKPDIRGWAHAPIDLNPQQFRNGDDEEPSSEQKIFRDTINVFPGYVTILRVKFAKNDGTLAKSFDMKGQRYVLHCHILEHEDNTMMINYCLE